MGPKPPTLHAHYVQILAAIAGGVASTKGAGYFTDGSAKDIAEAALKVYAAANAARSQANSPSPV